MQKKYHHSSLGEWLQSERLQNCKSEIFSITKVKAQYDKGELEAFDETVIIPQRKKGKINRKINRPLCSLTGFYKIL